MSNVNAVNTEVRWIYAGRMSAVEVKIWSGHIVGAHSLNHSFSWRRRLFYFFNCNKMWLHVMPPQAYRITPASGNPILRISSWSVGWKVLTLQLIVWVQVDELRTNSGSTAWNKLLLLCRSLMRNIQQAPQSRLAFVHTQLKGSSTHQAMSAGEAVIEYRW